MLAITRPVKVSIWLRDTVENLHSKSVAAEAFPRLTLSGLFSDEARDALCCEIPSLHDDAKRSRFRDIGGERHSAWELPAALSDAVSTSTSVGNDREGGQIVGCPV
jgi:hypothetical protein